MLLIARAVRAVRAYGSIRPRFDACGAVRSVRLASDHACCERTDVTAVAKGDLPLTRRALPAPSLGSPLPRSGSAEASPISPQAVALGVVAAAASSSPTPSSSPRCRTQQPQSASPTTSQSARLSVFPSTARELEHGHHSEDRVLRTAAQSLRRKAVPGCPSASHSIYAPEQQREPGRDHTRQQHQSPQTRKKAVLTISSDGGTRGEETREGSIPARRPAPGQGTRQMWMWRQRFGTFALLLLDRS
jgi:hypothetical protein